MTINLSPISTFWKNITCLSEYFALSTSFIIASLLMCFISNPVIYIYVLYYTYHLFHFHARIRQCLTRLSLLMVLALQHKLLDFASFNIVPLIFDGKVSHTTCNPIKPHFSPPHYQYITDNCRHKQFKMICCWHYI